MHISSEEGVEGTSMQLTHFSQPDNSTLVILFITSSHALLIDICRHDLAW